MKIWRAAVGILGLVNLVGCQQNPFPEGGRISLEAPPVKREIAAPYSLKVQSVMEFNEGVESSYKVDVWLSSSDGKGDGKNSGRRVKWKGLPIGVVWDPVATTLTWKPDFDAGNPTEGTAQHRVYEVEAILVDEQDPSIAIRDVGSFVVNNVPRVVTLNTSTTFSVIEGGALDSALTVNCPDAPAGPFSVLATGLPGGAIIEKTNNPKVFRLRYSPNYQVVNREESNSTTSTFNIGFVVFAPNGTQTSADAVLTVNDKRLLPVTARPSQVKQWPDIRFGLAAQDPNMEVSPTIQLDSAAPYGKVSIDVTQAAGLVSAAEVRWTDIPPEMAGKTGQLKFRVCTYPTTNCARETVTVMFDAPLAFPPLIDRTSLPLGITKYLLEGTAASWSIPVRAYSTDETAPKVRVEPEAAGFWNNGTLTLRSDSPGIKQIQLIAHAANGLEKAETFTFEVLPKSWSPVLILADSLRDPEVQATVKWAPQAFVMNPALSQLDERALSFRKVLVIGSSLLLDSTQTSVISAAARRVPNVILSTPLLKNLKDGLLAKELEAGGIEYIDTLSKANPPVELSEIALIPQKSTNFKPSYYPVGLRGTLTTHSKNPVLLRSTLTTSACVPQITYYAKAVDQKPEFERLAVVHCPRAQGGKLMVLGFELGDLVFDPRDQSILNSWIKNWMEAL